MRKNKSCYTPGLIQWVDFLICWKQQSHASGLDCSWYDMVQVIEIEMLKRLYHISDDIQLKLDDIESDIKGLEDRLGVELPPSYHDFLVIYEYCYREKKTHESKLTKPVVGFFELEDVGLLREYDPEFIEINEEVGQYPIHYTDEEYYRYRIGDINERTCYLKNSIVIGLYEDSSWGGILLYPDSVCIKNEWECAIYSHGDLSRRPLFAEMARQLFYMHIYSQSEGTILPYSQEKLSRSCANKIQLNNVWWE